MQLVTPGKILLAIVISLPAQQIFSQSSQSPTSLNFLSAKTSIDEYAERDFQWVIKHPYLFITIATRSNISRNERVGKGYQLSFPTIDIYSSAGAPIFFSDSSELNLKVIDALPRVIPEPDLNPRYKVRPSLRKALSMIPEIPHSDWATPAHIDYTILAMSLDPPDANASPVQKKALQRQKKRATYGVRVIHAPDPDPEETRSIALDDQAANEAQVEAIQRLRTRLKGSRIRVIEVRIEQ